MGNSAYNTIINCNISFNNGTNIKLTSSNYNLIYNNNFFTFGNYENQSYDHGTNSWDNGEKGNFWSDFKERYPLATDSNDDGIWDDPYDYEIPGKVEPNKDYYPLVKAE
jgi:nitrous oxidase accessory protein NosD